LDQFWGDAVLGVIGLDPQLAVNDVDVRERMMNPLIIVPPVSYQNEAVAGTIKDRNAGQIAVRVGNLRVNVEDSFDDIGVGG
jgi:hypothetical protein